MHHPKAILVVEDQPVLLEALVEALNQMYPKTLVVGAATPDDAERVLDTLQFDVLILDFRLGDETIETRHTIKRAFTRTPTVVISGYATDDDFRRLTQTTHAPMRVIRKPFDRHRLKWAIAEVVKPTIH